MSKDPKSEQAHRSRIEHYALKVQQLYNSVLLELATIAKNIKSTKKDKVFSFSDYPQTSKRLKETLENYASSLVIAINKGTTEEWYEASQKKDTKRPETDIYNARNKEALKAFQDRADAGITLSDRVWKNTQQMQQEVELALSGGILEGKSAAELARNIQGQLKEPNKLFRRVRDEFGILQLSKKALAYSPGQGVYRSSFKNALRLTRTEINMAYRTSDHFRWQNDPSVVGFEVRLSNRHIVRDICDDLKGVYPKDFLYRGWHVQCLCYKVPILMNDKDYDVVQKSILNGEEIPKGFKASNQVDDVPKGFKEWVKNNTEKSKNWKQQPYFIKDNFESGKMSGGLKDSLKSIKLDKIEKFKLTNALIEELTLSNKIDFTGRVENFNKIMEGFDLKTFDDKVTAIFKEKGLSFTEKQVSISNSKVNIFYKGDGMALERTFHFNGLKNVDHDYFKIPKGVQGGGLSKQLFRVLYEQYQNAGIQILNVHANIDVGGYTWAKYGFGATNNEFVYNLAKERLNKSEFANFNKIWDKSKDKKKLLNLISKAPFGKKTLLGSDWYGNIDLRNDGERSIFEKYIFGK